MKFNELKRTYGVSKGLTVVLLEASGRLPPGILDSMEFDDCLEVYKFTKPRSQFRASMESKILDMTNAFGKALTVHNRAPLNSSLKRKSLEKMSNLASCSYELSMVYSLAVALDEYSIQDSVFSRMLQEMRRW